VVLLPFVLLFFRAPVPGGTMEAYTTRTPGDEIVAATRARRTYAVWSTGSSSGIVGQSDQSRSSE
jgi:hypothetical protein